MSLDTLMLWFSGSSFILFLTICLFSDFLFFLLCLFFFFFFFFSSRRRHTRLVSDWSSDVCSSDRCERACASQTHGNFCLPLPHRRADARACGRHRRLLRADGVGVPDDGRDRESGG